MMGTARALAHDDVERFASDGYVLLRGRLDVDIDIVPIQRELGALIERAAAACGATWSVPSDPAEFDHGYLDLVRRFPQAGSIVYDMAKALPSFQRLTASETLVDMFRTLRGATLAGTAPGASGIRIDRPGDAKRQTAWHQEFPYQRRSIDGITFWIPLVRTTRAMGPVILASGSHRHGIDAIFDSCGNADALSEEGSYAGLRVDGEGTIPQRYPVLQPEMEPGDVLLFDFLTLHASGANVGERSRWSAQIRYFNFADPYGTSIGWAGGLKTGKTIAEMNADLQAAAAFGRAQ